MLAAKKGLGNTMAREILLAKFERKRRQMLLVGSIFVALVIVLVLASYQSIISAQQKIIESEAIRIARIVTEQAIVARSTYAKNVVDRLSKEGVSATHDFENSLTAVPIPAQFLKLMAHEVNERNLGLYKYRPLSKWNLNPAQGLTDNFQRWAFDELENQKRGKAESAVAGTPNPVWRIESEGDERMLRYMTADIAISEGCVSCHNAFELKPEIQRRRTEAGLTGVKVFNVGDIMGALEANIPLGKVESIASRNTRSSLNTVASISLLGLCLIGGVTFSSFNREKKAEQRAKIDAMTGLLNRTGFMDEGSFGLEICARKNLHAHLLYLDLNGFKAVNDTYGHDAGDAVLRVVGQRLSGITRSVDLVARLGGDEFCILMLGSKGVDLNAFIAKIKESVREPVPFGNQVLQVGTSIGCSVFPESADELSKLMKIADSAMYEDKQAGKKKG